jgi:uncharacterized protein YcfL
MGIPMRCAPSLLVGLLMVAGCSSNHHKTLMIDERQSVVMDSSVPTAGISAEQPSVSDDQAGKRASAQLTNHQAYPISIHYRFYWYDRQGLDILPFANVKTVVVPPEASVAVNSYTGNLEAQRVRLYLYL